MTQLLACTENDTKTRIKHYGKKFPVHRENFPPPVIIHRTAFHSSAKTAQYINRLGSRWTNKLTCFLGTNLASL